MKNLIGIHLGNFFFFFYYKALYSRLSYIKYQLITFQLEILVLTLLQFELCFCNKHSPVAILLYLCFSFLGHAQNWPQKWLLRMPTLNPLHVVFNCQLTVRIISNYPKELSSKQICHREAHASAVWLQNSLLSSRFVPRTRSQLSLAISS